MANRKAQAGASPGVIKALGLLTVNFNMLEQVIALHIWEFLGGDQTTGSIVTADLSYRLLVDKFCALYLERAKSQQADAAEASAEVAKLRNRLYAAGDKRNRLVHAVWGSGQEPGSSTKIKFTARGKGLRTTFEETSPAEVQAVADEIAALTGFLVRRAAGQDNTLSE